MRFLSFKALFLLVVLPPFLYVAALQGLESYLEYHYRDVIANRIPGDTQALLAGRVRLTDQLQAVIDDLIADAVFHHRGVVLSVVIRTRAGRRLYPPTYSEDMVTDPHVESMNVASENFALLNEGLDVSLDVAIGHNTLVANGLLVTCVFFSLAGLALVYRRGTRLYLQEEAQRRQQSEAIRAREEEQKVALAALEEQKGDLAAKIAITQSDLTAAQERAARNEADLFDEVETLENKLKQNLQQQEEQQNRVQELEDQLAQLAREREALSLQQSKVAGGLRKRLDTLYKNTSFSSRALTGLADLPESMQIKAEEVIHQLDAQAEEVPIKRKLFRGKGKETVFEIVFARKGRLYFRRTKARKVDILVIGTKNTQEKDLVYLDHV
jgi:predicted  nucleic acid-binding Zn-ribbon protein